MKSNKFKILVLAMTAILVQSTCVYAASDKEGYSQDELNNLQPGFDYESMDKSNQKVNSDINSYSSSMTLKEAAEKNKDKNSSTTTTGTTATSTADSTAAPNLVVKTQPSTGVKGDYWGKTSTGKWMLFEQGVPVVGWKMVAGKWYYMDLEGIMQTGWITYGENWYYLYPSGVMASNTTVDGYYLDWNGVWNG